MDSDLTIISLSKLDTDEEGTTEPEYSEHIDCEEVNPRVVSKLFSVISSYLHAGVSLKIFLIHGTTRLTLA